MSVCVCVCVCVSECEYVRARQGPEAPGHCRVCHGVRRGAQRHVGVGGNFPRARGAGRGISAAVVVGPYPLTLT